MNRLSLPITTLCFLLATGQSSAGEIFKWIDENGVVHFGDKAPENIQSEEIQLDIQRSSTSIPVTRFQKRQSRTELGLTDPQRDSRNTHPAGGMSGACKSALQQLSVLENQLPTYRDENDNFHNTVYWLLDPYNGQRVYLDDMSRRNAITSKKSEIQTHCANSGQSADELKDIGEELRKRSEKCKIAAAELELARDPSSHPTRQYIRDKEREVEEFCAP